MKWLSFFFCLFFIVFFICFVVFPPLYLHLTLISGLRYRSVSHHSRTATSSSVSSSALRFPSSLYWSVNSRCRYNRLCFFGIFPEVWWSVWSSQHTVFCICTHGKGDKRRKGKPKKRKTKKKPNMEVDMTPKPLFSDQLPDISEAATTRVPLKSSEIKVRIELFLLAQLLPRRSACSARLLWLLLPRLPFYLF